MTCRKEEICYNYFMLSVWALKTFPLCESLKNACFKIKCLPKLDKQLFKYFILFSWQRACVHEHALNFRCTFTYLSEVCLSLYHCSRPSAVACSHGCLLRRAVFPLIGQYAADFPVPQYAHKLPPGGLASALYSLAPGSWRFAESTAQHIPHGRSLPENRKYARLYSCLVICSTENSLEKTHYTINKNKQALTSITAVVLTSLCKAVLPHLSLASTLAPLFSREYTQSMCPLRTDSIRGVLRDNKQ